MTEGNVWSVYRSDNADNLFEMRWKLPRPEAERIAKEFNDKGHHQKYWHGLPEDHPNAIRMGVPGP